MRNADKTHCPQGHPYSKDNVLIRRGSRQCRKCLIAQRKASDKRNRDENARIRALRDDPKWLKKNA